MINVVSDLMGQRVVVRFRPYGQKIWWDAATGVVRGVALYDASVFVVLLEVEAPLGSSDTLGLYNFGMQEVPDRTLVTFSTECGRHEGGHVAIVVLRAPT